MFEIFTRLADWTITDVLALEPGTKLADAVHFFVEDTTKIFVLLVVIVFVMGLFRTMLSPEKVRGYIEGTSRGIGYILAVILGAVTPFCSCSSVPLFIGFLEGGIPVGVTMAFLITSPLVNEVAVVILGSIMGWKMTTVYVVTGMSVGILGGILIDRFHMERWVEDYVWKIRMGTMAQAEVDGSVTGRVRYAWGEVRDIVGRIWLYIIIGVGIGSALHGYVPQELFAQYASADNPFAVPVAVLMGLPLYSNATGIIPVAEALIAKGVPIGTVIAFMMSVVGVSPPEFIMLRKVLKPQMLIFFGVFLTISFMMVGYLLNLIFA
ncbi:Transporter [Paramagnetospirillum magnetotacticum MS-1]|uniref:Transporter n=1 Tax=Paramagnetospirillum magnetotacticum MS-1 TaxID=272627 RepID=A0A0C2V5U0_PARME|nr:permease [Paramagnetospirillum magnetotacticum]KIM00437.1 Transporter [Paramagnetospirillum magnetotacticum MS-1]